MKTWRTMLVTLGLVAMSGVAWGHGATGRGLGRDAVEPPETVARARLGANDVVGIPVGGHGRAKDLDVRARGRQTSLGAARLAPAITVQTVSGAAVAPVVTPVIVAERWPMPPNRRVGTTRVHEPIPVPIPPR